MSVSSAGRQWERCQAGAEFKGTSTVQRHRRSVHESASVHTVLALTGRRRSRDGRVHSHTCTACVSRLTFSREEFASRRLDPAAIDFAVLGIDASERSAFYVAYRGSWDSLARGTSPVRRSRRRAPPAFAHCRPRSAKLPRPIRMSRSPSRATGRRTVLISTIRIPAGAGGTGEAEDFILEEHGLRSAWPPFDDADGRERRAPVLRSAALNSMRSCCAARRSTAMRSPTNARFSDATCGCRSRFRSRVRQGADQDRGRREAYAFSTADGLAALKPVLDGGTVTFGSQQTHPADGNRGRHVVASAERAAELEFGSVGPDRATGLRACARRACPYARGAPIEAAWSTRAGARGCLGPRSARDQHAQPVCSSTTSARVRESDRCRSRAHERKKQLARSFTAIRTHRPDCVRSSSWIRNWCRRRRSGLFTGCAAGDTAMSVRSFASTASSRAARPSAPLQQLLLSILPTAVWGRRSRITSRAVSCTARGFAAVGLERSRVDGARGARLHNERLDARARVSRSSTPITAASSTPGCRHSTSSTSRGCTLNPDTSNIAFLRSRMKR